MKKIIIILSVILIGLSAKAFDWVGLGYQPYQQSNTPQTTTFSVVQPANPSYDNMFYQSPNQVQCQAPYVNPYLYRRPYGYINPYNYTNPYNVTNPLVQSPYNTTTTTTSSSVPTQIVRNIGQSMLYSMMRGY